MYGGCGPGAGNALGVASGHSVGRYVPDTSGPAFSGRRVDRSSKVSATLRWRRAAGIAHQDHRLTRRRLQHHQQVVGFVV